MGTQTTQRIRRWVVALLSLAFLAFAFVSISGHERGWWDSENFSIVLFFVLALTGAVISKVGSRWVQSALPPPDDPKATEVERGRFMQRSRRHMALFGGAPFAIIMAFVFLPAPRMEHLLSARFLVMTIVLAVIAVPAFWVVGHLAGGDLWAQFRPRIKK